MIQHNHYSTTFKAQPFDITLFCDRIYFQENIGSIFRLADAFGVKKIIFSGSNFVFSPRKINKTSRSTHLHIPYEIIDSDEVFLNVLNTFKTKIALEITTQSIPIQAFNIETTLPIALVLGSELYGINETVLNNCQHHIHIPMYGSNSSMNVTQALGITLYTLTNQFQNEL